MKKYLLLTLPVLLAACTPHNDLHSWMEQQKEEAAKIMMKPRPPVQAPTYLVYELPTFDGPNAFDAARLTLAKTGASGPNAPDMNRPREILEGFSLDKIHYVGSLEKKGVWEAFVRVDNHVYTVKKGNYLGSNYGVIQSISADRIVLEETVQNTEGGWDHRPAEITLGQ